MRQRPDFEDLFVIHQKGLYKAYSWISVYLREMPYMLLLKFVLECAVMKDLYIIITFKARRIGFRKGDFIIKRGLDFRKGSLIFYTLKLKT